MTSENTMRFDEGLKPNSTNQIRDPRIVSMADTDMNFQKDSTLLNSNIESCGGLPQMEDADSIEPLPKNAGLFNQGVATGSQASINDEIRSAAFGGDNDS